MQKNNIRFWLLTITTILFVFNCGSVYAQVMDLEVMGGGYRIKGPTVIGFPDAPASFTAQTTDRNIRDLETQDETNIANTDAGDFLWIEDQNGGNEFTVTVSSGVMTDPSSGITIPNDDTPGSESGLFIRNADSDGGTADIIANNAQTPLSFVTLESATGDYVLLDNAVALFSSDGNMPGSWRIFPVFRVEIPANTPPGEYTTTLTFTIS